MLLLEVADLDLLEAQHGEPCCDELLRTIAERLHEEVPEPSLVTRLHGGTFAIVLHDLGPGVAPDTVATHLLERAGEPCPTGDGHVQCAVVGGLAVPGDKAEPALQLFHRASRALARAKLRKAGQPRGTETLRRRHAGAAEGDDLLGRRGTPGEITQAGRPSGLIRPCYLRPPERRLAVE